MPPLRCTQVNIPTSSGEHQKHSPCNHHLTPPFQCRNMHKALVYEYMPNGSLHKWIFRGKSERRKIILDVVKGLTYLHEDCWKKIFHLDIKSHSMLVDVYLNAKIADFGLAKLVNKSKCRLYVVNIQGTLGYLVPKWMMMSPNIITEKVDVFSFGAVVLKIMCGRKFIDHSRP
ncbi:hypothetical protein C2S51_033164 [Perilla frutescens var. frutescens]|nr:hypothetical protein C2S51_033164 [Perilla frutescens var. frutescens]